MTKNNLSLHRGGLVLALTSCREVEGMCLYVKLVQFLLPSHASQDINLSLSITATIVGAANALTFLLRTPIFTVGWVMSVDEVGVWG